DWPDWLLEQVAKPQPAPLPQPNASGHSAGDPGTYRYSRVALDNQRQNVAVARKGSRNQELNNAALALGHLAHHGAFSEDDAMAALEAACRQNGLVADDGIGAFQSTFRSGWRKGLSEPKELPDRRPYSVPGQSVAEVATVATPEDANEPPRPLMRELSPS